MGTVDGAGAPEGGAGSGAWGAAGPVALGGFGAGELGFIGPVDGAGAPEGGAEPIAVGGWATGTFAAAGPAGAFGPAAASFTASRPFFFMK